MANKDPKDQSLDIAKLQTLNEPLLVRVRRIRGNIEQPIELPPKDDNSAPGAGWTREEILKLEGWLLTQWSGGGFYRATVVDARGVELHWSFQFPEQTYPARVPVNTATAATQPAAPAAPAAAPQQVAGPALPAGIAPIGSVQLNGMQVWPPPAAAAPPAPLQPMLQPQQPQQPAMQQMPQPQTTYVQPPTPWAQPLWPAQQPQQPYWQSNGYGQPNGYGQQIYPRATRFSSDDEPTSTRRSREADLERKELEKRLQQADLERKELEYKAALERQQQQAEMQMNALREEMRRLGETRNRGEDEEVRRVREEQARQREQADRERSAHERQVMEMQLQQMRQQHEQSMQLVREQMTQMAQALTAPRGESDELRQLRMEQERQRQDFERQRAEDQRRLEAERAESLRRMEMERVERERERERFERERRDEQLAREMRENREATERRIEQMMASQRASDPVLDALKETARMQAEQMREVARMQNESTARMAQFMVSPTQIAQLMKDNNTGADGVMRSMIHSVGEIGNLYKGAAEAVLQMSGGGGDSPAVRMLQEGMGRASEVAERYMSVQRDKVISEAKVKQAEAARDQTKIQAEAHLRAAAIAAQHGGQWAPPSPVAPATSVASGLNGATRNGRAATPAVSVVPDTTAASTTNANANTNTPAKPVEKRVGPIDYVEPAAAPKSVGPIDTYTEPPPPRNNTGPTPEEVFGIALESVERLRKSVADGKLTPPKAVDAILKGVEHVVTQQLDIPVFALFLQSRFADFIDLMLPEAPQAFRDECVQILASEIEIAKQQAGPELIVVDDDAS